MDLCPHLKTIGLVLAVLCAGMTYAQPDTLWTRQYGGARLDEFYAVKVALDDGYIAVGRTYPLDTTRACDLWVVKTDSLGNVQWNRSYGGLYQDVAFGVAALSDGRYAVAGYVGSDTSTWADGILLCLGADGDSLWCQVYGGPDWETIWSLCPLADGGYAMTGFVDRPGSIRDLWLLRTDAEGNLLWQRTYGGVAWDFGFEVHETDDGGLIVAGYTQSYGAGASDAWLLKTDSEGDSLWSHTYGGSGYDEARALQLTPDGGFIIAGFRDSFAHGFAAKTDSVGNVQWSRAFGTASEIVFEALDILPDGNYLLGGYYSRSVGDIHAWLLRLSAAGDSLWSREWALPHVSKIKALAPLRNGGYILAGLANWQQNLNSGQGWLARTSPFPLAVGQRSRSVPVEFAVMVYPNPFNASATISYAVPKAGEVSVRVFDVTGRLVGTLCEGRREAGEQAVGFEGKGLSSGVYVVRVEAGEAVRVEKMALLR